MKTVDPRDLARHELTVVLRELKEACCSSNPTPEDIVQRHLDALNHRPRREDLCD